MSQIKSIPVKFLVASTIALAVMINSGAASARSQRSMRAEHAAHSAAVPVATQVKTTWGSLAALLAAVVEAPRLGFSAGNLALVLAGPDVAASHGRAIAKQLELAFSKRSGGSNTRNTHSNSGGSTGSTTTTPTTTTPTTTTPTTTTPTTTTPTTTPTTTTPTTTTPTGTTSAGSKEMYWGAWIGSQFTGNDAPWDTNAIADFEQAAGKGVSLINFSSPWESCYSTPCTTYAFDTTAFNNVRNAGAIPFFSWGSDSLPFSVNEPNFSLNTIVAGDWDSYITSWATAAKNWGHPFFLRFDWEMNGNWFPWSAGANGNTAAEYVAAWRHVYNIFQSVGATNVTWVWCPNIDPYKEWTPLASLYPGDAYVNWTGLDVYNYDTPWMSFSQLAQSTYTQLVSTVAPSKPVVIGETASTESGGSKAAWITDLLTTQLPNNFPQIDAFLWFDQYDSGMDWPIETSSSAEAAFAAGIASPEYASNQFGSLSGGPIQPLS